MFFRQKKSGDRVYLQIVENRWEQGRSRQRVVATLGRLDQLEKDGQLDRLLASGARLSQSVMVLSAHRQGEAPVVESRRMGPALVFERLWESLGVGQVLQRGLAQRRFEFPVERAVWLTVLQRLFCSGSDRSCLLHWRRDYAIPGTEMLELHQMDRAMAWLGEPLPEDEQQEATPFSPRCVKDWVEEALFERRRDLFTGLELVFFDTTSIYFEGEGGEELGQYGHSKDHRRDRKQMIVGVVLDSEGRPLCCEMWPGNVTDVTTLIPVVDRLRRRFRIRSICIVADRGMISRKTIERLQSAEREVRFILGTRMRNVKEVHQEVLSRGGRYREVYPPRKSSADGTYNYSDDRALPASCGPTRTPCCCHAARTAFFLHRDSPRQEIDVEIVGDRTDRLLVDVFYNPGGEGARFDYGYRGAPSNIELDFDASEAAHRFAIEWDPCEIRWLVDEQLIHKRVNWDPTPIPQLPMTLHVNTWPSRSTKLAGRLASRRLPATAVARSIAVEASPVGS